MFFTTNVQEQDEQNLIRLMFGADYAADKHIPSYYVLNTPIRLQLMSFHPNEEDAQYSLTSISPEGTIYTKSTKEEFAHFEKTTMHHHDYCEIVFVIRGELHQLIENVQHIYTEGSCCILNKNVRHTELFDSDFQVAFLALSDTFIADVVSELSSNYFTIEKTHIPGTLESFFINNADLTNSSEKSYVDLIPIKDTTWMAKNIHNVFDQMTNEMIAPRIGSSHAIRQCFWNLLSLLSQSENFTTTPIQIGTAAENAIFNQITEKMVASDGRVTRSELVESLHYSGTYLNDITKKYTGRSIFDYGMYFCMKKAAEQLLTTSQPVSDIAADLGFSNRTHFYKIFEKHYLMTPSAYRKQFRKQNS